MPTGTIQDVFVYELASIRNAEQRLAQLLPQMAAAAQDEQVRQALQHHEQETQQQIRNLERCIEIMGAPAPQVTCRPAEGFEQERAQFAAQGGGPEAIAVFDLVLQTKIEHFEMAAYRCMVHAAQLLGQQEIVPLLQENLRQEEEMARKMETLGPQATQLLLEQLADPAEPSLAAA